MPPINNVIFGPFVFSSGYNPTRVGGPQRDTHLVEHQVPGLEGGMVEYVGSMQPKYQLRGFLAPSNEVFNGVAGAVLSGTGYVALTADDSLAFLTGLRGSGAQLLRVESTSTNYSGYPVLYENNFFYVEKATFGYEAGRSYPYYPYSIELRRASTRTFGQGSGTSSAALSISPGYFSGYAYTFTWRSGFYQGGLVIGLGFYANSIASGSARMAIYNVSGPQGTTQGLVAQSASQPVTSGWNYFPIRPFLLTMASGNFYLLGLMSNVTNTSGFSVFNVDSSTQSGTAGYQSGVIYNSGFPDPFVAGNSFVSGIQVNMQMVTV